jgi:hypothetical protein
LDKRDNRPAKGDGEPGEKIEMLLSPTSAGADKLFIEYGTSATDPAAQYCSHRKIQIGIASLLRIAVEPSLLVEIGYRAKPADGSLAPGLQRACERIFELEDNFLGERLS